MAEDLPEPFDASDAVAVNNATRDAERIKREDADVIRAIMHTKKGRAFMIRQLDRCYINSPAKFVIGQPEATAHNLGRESYGLELLQEVMAASVDLYMTAIKERAEEEARRNAVRREERKRRDEAERGPRAEDQVAHLNPPQGFPGHQPPMPPKK
ncbi:hypothetical protein ACRQ5Q_22355 [Bradyrhizobium sp. PMVTL-01]|uniref:hypothetical protein n=1 Tax=Bradyrhizobium sp. PMVTL-01 TaxID=3434999 RepID=UPI003F6F13F1